MARTSKINLKIIEAAKQHLKSYRQLGLSYPTSSTLANALGVHRTTLYNWAKHNEEIRTCLQKILKIHRGE